MSRQVLLEAMENDYVAYCGTDGRQIGGFPVGERPATPPVGTIYECEYTLLSEVTTEDGELIEKLDGFPLKVGPRKFVRGRVVTNQKEAEALLMPPLLWEFVSQLKELVRRVETMMIDGTHPKVVAITTADGTEVGILLGDKDTTPPEGASPYPVGESPEELAEADAKADPEWDEDFDDEEDAYGLTKVDYAGATVGICPSCLQVHSLQPGIVGLTDEEAQAERQRRGTNEVQYAELEEIGGESGS